MGFEGSSLWRIRQRVGHDLVLWPGASVVVEDADGRVLLGLRGDSGEWAMPGGGSEEGSSFATTALTELREETGLEANVDDLIAFATVSAPADHVNTYANGDVTHYFGLYVAVRDWRGEPTPDGDELVELRWFARDALPDPLMHSSAVALRYYAAFLETGVFQIG